MPLDREADRGLCAEHLKTLEYRELTLPSPAKAVCFVEGCQKLSRAPPGSTQILMCEAHTVCLGGDTVLKYDGRWTARRWTSRRMKVITALADMGMEGRPYVEAVETDPSILKHLVKGSSEFRVSCSMFAFAWSWKLTGACCRRPKHVPDARSAGRDDVLPGSLQASLLSSRHTWKMQHAFQGQ